MEFPIETYLRLIQQKRQQEAGQGNIASALGQGLGAGITQGAQTRQAETSAMRQQMPGMRQQMLKEFVPVGLDGSPLDGEEMMRAYESAIQGQGDQLPEGYRWQRITAPDKGKRPRAFLDQARLARGEAPFLLTDTGQYAPSAEGYETQNLPGSQERSVYSSNPEYRALFDQAKAAYAAMRDAEEGRISESPAKAKANYEQKRRAVEKWMKDNYGAVGYADLQSVITGGWQIGPLRIGGTETFEPVGGTVERKTKDGRIAVFDATTQEFIRYKDE